MDINKDSQKAPNLRFKGFTDDWEQRKLSNLGNLNRGKSKHRPRNDPKLYGGEYPFIQTGDVATAGLFLKDFKQTYNTLGISQSKLWKKGTLLITIAANIAETSILSIDAAFPDSIIGFESKQVDMIFIKSVLDNSNKKIKSKAETSSQSNLNLSKLSELDIWVPTLGEQKKIGFLFQKLDNTIDLHQRKLDQLNQLKEALLQQMFPGKGEMVPKLRFAGFEGDWEERKLGDLLHERNQKSVQTEEYPLVSFTVENGVTEKTERYNRNQLVSGDSDAKVYKVTKLNDIVYNPANLKFGAIDRNKYGKAVFSPIYVTFEVIEDYIFAEFIEFIVTSQTFIGRALKYQQGTVYERQSVGVDDFLNLTVRIPNLDEQKLIGLFLNNLNKELLLQKDKLDQLKHMKQVLLQNMFI